MCCGRPCCAKKFCREKITLLGAMIHDSPFASQCNSDDKEGVPNIRERDEAKYAVAETLMGMGQGLKKVIFHGRGGGEELEE